MIPVPGSSVHVAIIWGRYICTINLLVICTSMCIYIYICILYIYIYLYICFYPGIFRSECHCEVGGRRMPR